MKKAVRIGNSSGFWGDEPLAMKRQVEKGALDYLVADYLAEVSMSILHKQMMRRPDLGYVPDFIEHMRLVGDSFKSSFPKIVTNAGGKNPIACAQEVQKLLNELGIQKKVMAVVGDDLMPAISPLTDNNSFENLETKAPFSKVKESLVVANVYTSSEGIVRALKQGADIVITGRASDSALTIGPLVHEFGWHVEDWDKIAAGMLAGHVLECGAQASGGNFTDWRSVTSWDEMGYPIVEVSADGSFMATKAYGTGGLINQWTVKEQLVYEIADPANYMGPDVVADLTEVKVVDLNENEVSVSGVKGKPAPETWKVSMAYQDGHKAVGNVVIGGVSAFEKAEIVKNIFWNRFEYDFDKTSTNLIGADALGQSMSSRDTKEVLLQFVAFDRDRAKLEKFSKEIAGLILSGPQGMAAYGGRPKIQEVISYWPTLVNKKDLEFEFLDILVDGEVRKIDSFNPAMHSDQYKIETSNLDTVTPINDISKPYEDALGIDMVKICMARSGDKGNGANIGVLARSPAIFDFLKKNFTTNLLKSWVGDLCKGEVVRYEMETINGFNFMLSDVLDGGGTKSGRLDPQGKMLAAILLAQKIYVPKEILDTLN